MEHIRWPNIGFFLLACALPLFAILLSTNDVLPHTYLALTQAMLIGFSIMMTSSLSRRWPHDRLKIRGSVYRILYIGVLVVAAVVYAAWVFEGS